MNHTRSKMWRTNVWWKPHSWQQIMARLVYLPRHLSLLSAAVVLVVAALPLLPRVHGWLPTASLFVLANGLLLTMMAAFYFSLGTELRQRQRADARSAASLAELEHVSGQYRLLAEYSSDVIIHIGFDAVCRYVSPAMEQMLGWTNEDLVGKQIKFLIHPEDIDLLHEEVEFLAKGNGQIRSHFRARHADGSYLWIEAGMQVVMVDGAAESFVANMRDISERIETERRLAEAAAEMAQLAATDQLTGLANRRRFNHELGREWRRAVREQNPLSVLLLDVDFFKSYNDTYGHQGGDEVLQIVARTISTALHRSPDLPARWGGEEFVVLLPATDLTGAIAVAERLRASVEALKIPHLTGFDGHLTISVGVATAYPTARQTPEPLIAEADANLYEAKHRGRNRVGAPPTEPLIWAGI